jgi:hypothetical protein
MFLDHMSTTINIWQIQATTRWRPEKPELIKGCGAFDHTVKRRTKTQGTKDRQLSLSR